VATASCKIQPDSLKACFFSRAVIIPYIICALSAIGEIITLGAQEAGIADKRFAFKANCRAKRGSRNEQH